MPGFGLLPLRVALVAGLILAADTSGPLAQQRVGVSSAVNPEAVSRPPGGTARRLVIGQEIVFNERITTEAAGQTQLLFLDESSMTIGPNSDLTIDQFVYDPKSGTGKLAMSATRGLLRYVGGKLSKQDDAVTLRTSTATLAVRGGAFIANIAANGTTEAVFIYGKGLAITGAAGGSQIVTRPGFYSIIPPGGSPSTPGPAPTGLLAGLTQQLDGRSGGTGGAPTSRPTIMSSTAACRTRSPATSAGASSKRRKTRAGGRAFSVKAASRTPPRSLRLCRALRTSPLRLARRPIPVPLPHRRRHPRHRPGKSRSTMPDGSRAPTGTVRLAVLSTRPRTAISAIQPAH